MCVCVYVIPLHTITAVCCINNNNNQKKKLLLFFFIIFSNFFFYSLFFSRYLFLHMHKCTHFSHTRYLCQIKYVQRFSFLNKQSSLLYTRTHINMHVRELLHTIMQLSKIKEREKSARAFCMLLKSGQNMYALSFFFLSLTLIFADLVQLPRQNLKD